MKRVFILIAVAMMVLSPDASARKKKSAALHEFTREYSEAPIDRALKACQVV